MNIKTVLQRLEESDASFRFDHRAIQDLTDQVDPSGRCPVIEWWRGYAAACFMMKLVHELHPHFIFPPLEGD